MYDTIIVGAGPASLSAAIYLKNANKNILILEKSVPGGNILKANKINNYLGFDGEHASDLAYKMYKQVQDLGIDIKMEKVLDIKDNNIKEVITNKSIYKTKSILIACGRVEKPLGIKNEEDSVGKGISYCVKCDASLYKGKVVALVGDFEDALYLSDIASKVIYINPKDDIKCDRKNIEIKTNKEIISINKEEDKIKSITLSDQSTYEISCLFIENGYTPNLEFIKSLDINTNNNYIITDEEMRTNIKGIYAAGDIVHKKVYQIITAAAEGAIAALSIIKDINKE